MTQITDRQHPDRTHRSKRTHHTYYEHVIYNVVLYRKRGVDAIHFLGEDRRGPSRQTG
jgi:hypothetical protein